MHDKLWTLAFLCHPPFVNGWFSPFCAPCFRHFDNTFTNPCALSLPPLPAKKKRRMTGVWASPSGTGRIPSLRPSMQKRPQNRRLCGKSESDENFVKSPSLSLTTLLIQFAIFLPCTLLMRGRFPSPRPVLWRASAPPSIPWSAVRSVLQSPYSEEWPTSKYLRAT